MDGDPHPTKQQLDAALVDAMRRPLRFRVLCAVHEYPGVTVNQIARRIDTPPRQVRYQLERLIDAGLVAVDAETAKRNTRERHHVSLVRPEIDELESVEESREVSISTLSLVTGDFARAVRSHTFGRLKGHTGLRFPGEVDERGWEELGEILREAAEQIEAVMADSVARLEASGESGVEAVAALLLFEVPPWDSPDDRPPGPRPSLWRTTDGSSDGVTSPQE